jgi:hypothetical protein
MMMTMSRRLARPAGERKGLSHADSTLCKELHAESSKMGAYCKDLNPGDGNEADDDEEKSARFRAHVKGMFETALEQRTNSFWNLTDVLRSCIWNATFEDECAEIYGRDYDLAAALREILSEFTERVVSSLSQRR